MTASPRRTTARDRIRRANVNVQQLYWLRQIAGLDALDELPGDAVFVPGEVPQTTASLVDLSSGQAIERVESVPAGTVYATLEALEPYLRAHADEAYEGQAGMSGRGIVLGSTPQEEGTLTGEP